MKEAGDLDAKALGARRKKEAEEVFQKRMEVMATKEKKTRREKLNFEGN